MRKFTEPTRAYLDNTQFNTPAMHLLGIWDTTESVKEIKPQAYRTEMSMKLMAEYHDPFRQGCSLGLERLGLETVSRRFFGTSRLVSVLKVERLGLVSVL